MSNIFVFRQPPHGVISEYFGGGGKGGTTVQSTQIPPEVLARYNAVNAQAEQVAQTPFQSYGGEFVAPINQTQQAGIDATSNYSQLAQPFYGAAAGATLGSMQNVGPLTQQQIGYYQNPYTQAVVNPTIQALQQQQGQQLAGQQGQAIMSGAFGGDRANLARAQLQGQQNLALGQAIAPLYQQGFNTAANIAAGQQTVEAADLARQMAGGMQLGNLGTAAQQAALSGAQAQIAAGTLPQQTQQALDTAQYNQFLQARGYPFQTTQFLANIAEGTGALSGNTTTQTQSGGFFSSDARLKENIEPVGKLYDGQHIYRYNYKDDPEKNTQIGLIAQEALHHGKRGIGLDPDGYLAVNYRDVTDDAAKHGTGLVPNSMGGAVMSSGAYARGGFALGGEPDFGSLVSAHGGMYDQMGGKDKMPGLNIPSQQSTARLQPTPMLPKRQEGMNPLQIGKGIAETGESIKKMSQWKPVQGAQDWWKDHFGDKTPATGQVDQGKNAVGTQPDKKVTENTQQPGLKVSDAGTQADPNAKPAWYNPNSDANSNDPLAGKQYTANDLSMNDASMVDAPEADATNWQDLGNAADDVLSSSGDLANFGDMFAYGGLVPRQHHAAGKAVMPGMDDSQDPIGDVVSSGEQDTKSLESEQHGINDQKMSSSGGGGGGFNPLSLVGPILSFLKDGGRVGYADGGGDRLSYDGLQNYQQATSSRPNELPLSYNLDDGTQLRGSGSFSGPYAEYGVGLGTGLGGGRLEANLARGSAPHSPAQYHGGLSWTKPFAYGGLVPREHHDGSDGNTVGSPDQDLDYMARTMLREAEGEGNEGMAAVGHVMKNRMNSGNFGKTMADVATAPNQFTPWNEDLRGTKQDPRLIDPSSDAYKNAFDIARKVQSGDIEDPTSGATHFANLSEVQKNRGSLPDWLQKMVDSGNTTQIKNHTFGRADDSGAPRPPLNVGPSEQPSPGLSFGPSGKGMYNKVSSDQASLGDVAREFLPSSVPTSESFWVPAASFLGGMLASPNRTFLGALGSGLVSGVSGQMEYDRLQQQALKNAMDVFKDRFEDAVVPGADGKSVLMKRDKYTNSYYTPDQLGTAQAQLLKSMGVANPGAYGVKGAAGAAQQTGQQGTAQQPASQQVSGAGAPAKPATEATAAPAKEKAPDAFSVAATSLGYAPPPKGLSKTDMSEMQLRSNALYNWQNEGLQDPRPILQKINALKADQDAWQRAGASGVPHVQQLQGDITTQQNLLNDMLKNAVSRDVAKNLENDKSTITRANAYKDDIDSRKSSYESNMNNIDELARIIHDSKSAGGFSAARNQLAKYWTSVFGTEAPAALSSNNPDDFDYAVKLAYQQIAQAIPDQGGQRAPRAMAEIQGKIAPNIESLSLGGIYQLLGQRKADLMYNVDRDNEYVDHNLGKDPTIFKREYDKIPDKTNPKWTGQDKYNRFLADAYNSLPVPQNDPKFPEVANSLHSKLDKYGLRLPGEEGAAPAASAVTPGQSVGQRKQFKQGWGVWNGRQWVPEAQ